MNDDRPEPPDLDLELWHRNAPFPPTWEERDKLLAAMADALRVPPEILEDTGNTYANLYEANRRQPRLDTGYLFGPDPIPRRAPK